MSDQTPRYVDGILKRVAVPTRSSPAHLGKEFLVWGVRHQVEVVLLSFPVELSAEGIRAGEHSPLRRAESELLEGRPFGLVTMATWSCILKLQTPPLPRNVVDERPGLLLPRRRRRAQLERLAGTSFEGRPNVAQPPSRSRCGPLRGRHREREREREEEMILDCVCALYDQTDTLGLALPEDEPGASANIFRPNQEPEPNDGPVSGS